MTAIGDDAAAPAPAKPRALDPNRLVWIAFFAVAVPCFALRREVPWLVKYPRAYMVPVHDWLNLFMDWFVDTFKWLFHAIAWVLDWPMDGLQLLLQWLPWPATIAAIALLAHLASGWRLAAFSAGALSYMVVVGYWDESMRTLALVGVSVPLSVAIGLGLGVLAFKARWAERVIQPTLDLMQTIPTFAYLIPILLLFGFGPVVGLIASAVYACPPMVRNVLLGLQRVPSDVVESARMSGTTERQLLWWVRVPSALPAIMIGVNQTTMAALSMVIIAAIIGGYADIGWEVLSTMRRAAFGQSLLAGVVIVLIAMIMDRVSRGFTDPQRLVHHRSGSIWRRHAHLWLAFAAVAAGVLLAEALPVLRHYPDAWVIFPAEPLDDAIIFVTVSYPHVTDAIKNATLFFLMLPLKVGLENTIKPLTWGFALTLPMSLGYGAAVLALAAAAARAWRWRAGVAILLLGGLVYFGTTQTPWPVFILAIAALAWQVCGWRVALFATAGLVLMLVTGHWPQTMLSVYLCGAAVFIAFAAGGLLGIWAARNDRVSAFLRPINDTLQTIPLFVFLIPVIMFFRVGDFPALLAIIAYAIVPSIRYTEHALRSVRPEVVEAATALGCTPRQLLWQVQMPLALPEIMLGLNQTIMYGLAMLVIAALVGTRGLGQAVYIALGQADFGKGAIAGMGIAIIAITADRIIQGWSNKKKLALGLAREG